VGISEKSSELSARIRSLSAFDALRLKSEEKTIVIVCLGENTYSVTCFFPAAEMTDRVILAYNEKNNATSKIGMTNHGRQTATCLVNDAGQATALVKDVAAILGIEDFSGPSQQVVRRERITHWE
jgi:hypothetical protein